MAKVGFWEKLGRFATNPTVIGWICVLVAALAMSDYSLFIVARYFSTPPVFAVLGGVIFDGAAVVFATISFNSVRSGYPGSGAKLGTILCALLSAYINSYHQTLLNQPLIAKLFWAAPPIIAVSVFEAHIRFVKRRTLANQGRIAPDLPVLGKWSYLLFPVKSVRIMRTIVRYRLGFILARQTPGMRHTKPPVPLPGTGPGSGEITAGSRVSGVVSPGFSLETPGNPASFSETYGLPADSISQLTAEARVWARRRGMNVSRRGPLPQGILSAYFRYLEESQETDTETDETPRLREVSGE